MAHAFFLDLAGGVLIGAAAGLFMLTCGRVAGISGIAAELTGQWSPGRAARWSPRWPSRWRQDVVFLAGLPLGLLLWQAISGHPVPVQLPGSNWLLVSAGLLVGVGARLGSGCTSGHGVCGLARLSPRSLAATGTFMLVAILVVALHRWLG